MKTKREVEVNVCDFCKERDGRGYDPCLRCGKIACYECEKTNMVDYPHSIYASGSGDGAYCVDCNAALIEKQTPIFSAYRAITRLRMEAKAWGEDFELRRKAAEERLKSLQREVIE